MALFVGNISSRVRQTELERTFQRFGRSKFELKDGYGFVVYDTVRDAEKALRALKGRIICGEQLSITWSRKQRPFRRFSGKDFPRSYGNKDFRKEDREIKGRSSQEWEEIAKDINKHASHKEGTEGNGFMSKEGRVDGFKNDIVGEAGKCQNLLEAASKKRCKIKIDPVPLENDRWGEPLSEASDEHDITEEATNLQCYDPYSADNKKDEDAYENEKYQKVKSNHSYAANSSERGLKHRARDEAWMGHGGFRKSLERCYICGKMGHVMRQCRSRVVSRREKFDRFGHKRNSERNLRGNGFMRFKGPREMEWSRWDLTRESIPKSKDFNGRRFISKDRRLHDRTEGFSEKKRKNSRHLSDDRKEAQTREMTGMRHKKHRTDSISQQAGGRHKSHSSDPQSESQHQTHSNCSSPSSESSFSRSQSSSSSSLLASSRSHSCSPRSGSRSSRSHSLSSHPRSQSVSSYTKSAKPVSKSRSSSVTPRSLSVSLSPRVRRLPSSTWLDHGLSGSQDATFSRQSLKHNSPSEVQKDLSEQMIHGNDVTEHMEKEYLRLAVKVENDLRVRIIEDNEIENPGRCIDERGDFMYSESTGKRENSSNLEGNANSAQVADKDHVAEDYGMKDGMVRSPELKIAELSVDTSMQVCFENLSMAHVKVGDESSTGKGSEKCAANISLDEVNAILHQSRGMPIEDAKHGSSVESNIGAARLWPWEVILYRRLKRGAISTPNYAGRMSQNKMFGIVDKYIRSSSGWWENESHEH